jgi:hypothetical protein
VINDDSVEVEGPLTTDRSLRDQGDSGFALHQDLVQVYDPDGAAKLLERPFVRVQERRLALEVAGEPTPPRHVINHLVIPERQRTVPIVCQPRLEVVTHQLLVVTQDLLHRRAPAVQQRSAAIAAVTEL